MKTACTYLSFVRAALNLTVREVKALEQTPCENEWLKRAFLFSCFCGLRIGDIENLRWKNLVKNGDDWQIEIVQQKTEASLFLPINRHARKWLPKQGDSTDEDLIFARFNRELPKRLHQWIERGCDVPAGRLFYEMNRRSPQLGQSVRAHTYIEKLNIQTVRKVFN